MFKQRTILVMVAFLFTLTLSAQEQLKHEKKIFTRKDGRVFIQKLLPLYLRLSTSPNENSPSQLLKSESSPQYTNPFYLDTEGYNSIRTPSKVDTATKTVVLPLQDIIFEVYADGVSPNSSVSYDKSKSYKKSEKIFFGQNPNLTVSSVDEMSGTEKIYYSVDKENFREYSQALTFDREKEYILKYYAVDNVGNAEKVREFVFTVDQTPPASSHKVEGDLYNDILSNRSKIVLSSQDAITGVAAIKYKIDGGSEKNYSTPINASSLDEGEHTLVYYAADNVGNKESEISYKFFVDKTAPIVVEEVIGDQFFVGEKSYSSGRTKLKLTAVDNKAGVKDIFYSISNASYSKYDKPFYFSSKTGTSMVHSYAVDNVNNKSSSSTESKRSGVTYVDLTGPVLSHGYIGPNMKMRDTMFISKETKIRIFATDAEAGLQKITYILDKDAETEYKEPFPVLAEGFHKIEYFGFDNVNNSNRNDFFFVVDNTGPDIYERFGIVQISRRIVEGKTLDVYPAHTTLFLSATDEWVGYERMYYSINGAAEKTYSGVISGFLKGTQYTIKVRSLDKLGNQKEKTFEFMTE